MSKNLTINYIIRATSEGKEEGVEFHRGLNALAGPPNTGKTLWLNMLDYLLGDTGKVDEAIGGEDARGVKLTEKYVALRSEVEINAKKYLLERQWRDPGMKTKIIVNGEPTSDTGFSKFILSELGIPVLHFPKGSPYAERSWPELSWRMLMRHIYRQERFWSDIADKQPEIEQFAVISQFLGFAEKIFSQELGRLVDRRKELFKLQAQKDQFERILDNITKSMTSKEENVTFATSEFIEERIRFLENEISHLIEERKSIISKSLGVARENEDQKVEDIRLSEERTQVVNELENLAIDKNKIESRLFEFNTLHNDINHELVKLERIGAAAPVLADLPITHCPACDREMAPDKTKTNECFLCHQPIEKQAETDRLDFEINHLKSELREVNQIISELNKNLEWLNSTEAKLNERLTLLERRLKPIRQSIAAFVDSKLSLVDAERGKIEEQIENYKRILNNLDFKNELIRKIDILNGEIRGYESSLDELSYDLNFASMSNDIEEGMMNYLNLLNLRDRRRWPLGRIKLILNDRAFRFRINDSKWGSIGGTFKVFFLLAYHYSLLSLSKNPNYNYPGFLIIDFPPELADEIELEGKVNYLIEPFAELCNKTRMPMQVIIAGRAFESLENANVLKLDKVWK